MPPAEKPKVSEDSSESESLSSILSHDTIQVTTARWDPKEGKQRSEDIDRYLEAESAKLKRQVKVLVLGHNDPKDVFWKRTNLLGSPLTNQDRADMTPALRKTVFAIASEVASEVLSRVEKLEPHNQNNEIAANKLREILEYEGQDFGHRMDALCTDQDFHDVLASNELTVDDVATRLLTSRYTMFRYCPCADQNAPLTTLLKRVLAKDYTPTDHDYIHFDNRHMHSYLRETQLRRDTHLLRVLDLHAGRGERKKWIHLFEDMRCVVFAANLAEYVNYEEELDYSPLRESIVLFESVARSRWFKDTPMICVLCNVDAFKGLLKNQPLEKWFPSYQGTSGDQAVQFLVDLVMRAADRREDVQVQVCNDLCEDAVRDVFELMDTTSLKTVLDGLGNADVKAG